MIPRTWSVVLVIAAAVAPYAGPAANAQAPAPTKPDAAPAATPPPAAPRPAVMKAKRFESTEAATQAFVAALRGGDTKGLVSILGSEGRTLISSPARGPKATGARVRARRHSTGISTGSWPPRGPLRRTANTTTSRVVT